MITVTLYEKSDCSLCVQAKQDLDAVQETVPHRLVVINIEEDASLERLFGEKVPVVEIGPYRKEAPFNRQDLQITIKAAKDRMEQLEKLDDPKHQQRVERAQTVTRIDRASYWFANRYLLVFNLLVFLYVGVPFLAPVFMNAGLTAPATLIYRAYGAVCHQFAFRSWFLFGDQAVYPRAAAEVPGVASFGEATGVNESDIFEARRFIGNDQLGYKVAFCERDVAIYGGILSFGILFALSGRRLRGLHWILWIAIGIAPIGLDGLSQLLSQPPFEWWAYRESTPLLRTLTGFLFGFATAWFGYPQVDEAMQDTRKVLAVKFARLKNALPPTR